MNVGDYMWFIQNGTPLRLQIHEIQTVTTTEGTVTTFNNVVPLANGQSVVTSVRSTDAFSDPDSLCADIKARCLRLIG